MRSRWPRSLWRKRSKGAFDSTMPSMMLACTSLSATMRVRLSAGPLSSPCWHGSRCSSAGKAVRKARRGGVREHHIPAGGRSAGARPMRSWGCVSAADRQRIPPAPPGARPVRDSRLTRNRSRLPRHIPQEWSADFRPGAASRVCQRIFSLYALDHLLYQAPQVGV